METASESQKGRRWKTVLLVFSLGLNLALVGLIAGVAIRGPSNGGGFGIPVDGFRTIVQSMEEADRNAVWKDVRSRGSDLRAARRDMRALRREFLSILRADDFSEEKLADLFERQSQVLQGLGSEAQVILIARIADMSAEQRATLASRLEEQMRKGWRQPKPPRER